MIKSILKSRAAAACASFFIRSYIRIVWSTSRWQFEGREHYETAAAKGKGVIFVFWHSRLLMTPILVSMTEKRVFMLISNHRDGEIITNAVRPFGVNFIRGSAANPKKPEKDKSGAPAITQMIAALAGDEIIGLTPDGPRGPAEKVKIGVIKLAQLSGAPILPIAYGASRKRRLTTWDRFYLALPFSKGLFMAGPPIEISEHSDREAIEIGVKSVENALEAVTRAVDRASENKV